MWISQKTAEIKAEETVGAQVGVVSLGGKTPAVLTDGEVRRVEILRGAGILNLPRVGDRVLLERTAEGEAIILGTLSEELPADVSEGDIYIGVGNASIHIKANGNIDIEGILRINGSLYVP